MNFGDITTRGMHVLGCGKMGSALLAGWLKGGLPPSAVHVTDPYPSDWLKATGVALNTAPPTAPAVMLIAVKPQMMAQALPQAAALGGGNTLILTVAAGTPITAYEAVFGPATPIIRAMPNTPAAIGQGITALCGNDLVTPAQMELARVLMSAVGEVVMLAGEHQMDAVTGLSGSGPAYVFHLIECMAAAGEAQGLPAAMALQLATSTVAGAGALAAQAPEAPDVLRRNVTSPNGTTQAALELLMDATSGLPPLMARSIAASAARSKELSNE